MYGTSHIIPEETIMSQTHEGPERELAISTPPPTPRWVKVFAIILIVLVLLFGILHLTGNSLGGPGSHMPSMQQEVQQP